MGFPRHKWIPDLKEQTNGDAYKFTYDGCGGFMKDHYKVDSVVHSQPSWGFDRLGNWVLKQPSKITTLILHGGIPSKHGSEVFTGETATGETANGLIEKKSTGGHGDLVNYEC